MPDEPEGEIPQGQTEESTKAMEERDKELANGGERPVNTIFPTPDTAEDRAEPKDLKPIEEE